MLKGQHPDYTDLSTPIGEAIQTRRTELNFSIQTVADKTGLPVGFVSQVERGLSAPFLFPLISIASVFALPICRFLDQPELAAGQAEHSKPISQR